MNFPETEIEFEELMRQGKTVEYTCTDTQTAPDESWSFWGINQSPDGTMYVWRRIVNLV